MLATVLAAVLAIGPASPPTDHDPMLIHEIAMAEVAAVSFGHYLPIGEPDAALDVFVLMKEGGSALISGGFYTIVGRDFCVFQTGAGEEPVVLSTSWSDIQNNVHTVTTDCDKFPTLTQCVTAHRAALKIMATAFPKSGLGLIPMPNGARVRIGSGGE